MVDYYTKAVTNFLLGNQCPHLRGYDFLKQALVLALEDERKMESLGKCLYYEVAEKFMTDTINVEKCIRDVVRSWFNLNKIGGLFDEKPTNKDCITRILDNIKVRDFEPYVPLEDIPMSVYHTLFN